MTRRVVVTGAGGGIGAALARRFAADGAEVIVSDLDPAAAAAVASEIGGLSVPGDAANEEDTRRLIETAWAELGGLDLFCSNAGVLTAGDENTPDAAWTRDFSVKLTWSGLNGIGIWNSIEIRIFRGRWIGKPFKGLLLESLLILFGSAAGGTSGIFQVAT